MKDFNDYINYLKSFGYGASAGMTEPIRAGVQSMLPYGQSYKQELENVRNERKQLREQYPIGSQVAEISGMLSAAPAVIAKGVIPAMTLGGLGGYNEDQTLGSTLLGGALGATTAVPFSKAVDKLFGQAMMREEAKAAAARGEIMSLSDLIKQSESRMTPKNVGLTETRVPSGLRERVIESGGGVPYEKVALPKSEGQFQKFLRESEYADEALPFVSRTHEYTNKLGSWLANEEKNISDLMASGYKNLKGKNAELGSELLAKANEKLQKIKSNSAYILTEGEKSNLPMDVIGRFRDITEPQLLEYRKLISDYQKIAK